MAAAPSKAGEEMTKAGLVVQHTKLIKACPAQNKPHWHLVGALSLFLEPYLLLPREFQCRIRMAAGSVLSMSILVSGRLMNGWAFNKRGDH